MPQHESKEQVDLNKDQQEKLIYRLRELVRAGIRWRRTPVVADEFPELRDKFDLELDRAERLLNPLKHVDIQIGPAKAAETANIRLHVDVLSIEPEWTPKIVEVVNALRRRMHSDMSFYNEHGYFPGEEEDDR